MVKWKEPSLGLCRDMPGDSARAVGLRATGLVSRRLDELASAILFRARSQSLEPTSEGDFLDDARFNGPSALALAAGEEERPSCGRSELGLPRSGLDFCRPGLTIFCCLGLVGFCRPRLMGFCRSGLVGVCCPGLVGFCRSGLIGFCRPGLDDSSRGRGKSGVLLISTAPRALEVESLALGSVPLAVSKTDSGLIRFCLDGEEGLGSPLAPDAWSADDTAPSSVTPASSDRVSPGALGLHAGL
mmetsp:Transcript_2410/g.4417  ORF Transcript_2410/g.4417 Transcript_2410/m.4417 type:complete len:243 (+) Transcript_2410:1060-1788(+)